MRLWLLILLLLLNFSAFAQRYTVSGKIADSLTNETLINASVFDAKTQDGSYTNEYGFYSLSLPEGKIKLEFSHIGYKSKIHSFQLSSDTTLHVSLPPGREIKKVTVTEDRSKELVYQPQTSLIQLQPESIEKMPVLMGEPDLVKTLQHMPGVQGGKEGFSGMHVRGGNNDQNLILLDGVPVYNVNHFFGLFSVFHPAAIKDVKLYKGGFPARYNGRVSSVLDIRMKEGNMKDYHGEGSIGLIASKLSFEGPIKEDTSSFIISARRTYLDLLFRPIMKLSPSNGVVGYFFQDINAKVNYKFSDKSRLYLSGYLGEDDFYHKIDNEYTKDDKDYSYEKESGLEWGNQTGVLRWNYIFNSKLFSNLTLSYSNFRFLISDDSKEETDDKTEEIEYEYRSGIQNFKAKYSLQYIPAPNHHVRFGVDAGYSVFNPGMTLNSYSGYQSGADIDNSFGNNGIYTREYSAFIEDKWEITDRLGANIGLNYNGFLVGDTHYNNLEPRITARYLLNDHLSVKGSYCIMNQYLHLLTNSTIGLPTDLWVPSTEKIQPVHSSQYTLGISADLSPSIDAVLEGYYKDMTGLTEYKEGANYFSQKVEWEDKITSGEGTSYGGELFIEKNKGNTTGWVSYALTWSNRTFEQLNFGNTFPFKYDRRHVFNITINQSFTKNFSVNGTWVYKTGRTATYPTQSFMPEKFGTRSVMYYQSKNNLRFPPYHRLDIGLNFKKKKKWGTRTWRIGLYNAYSRINPFYLYYKSEEKSFMKVGILPVLPFISYNFKF